MSPRFDSSTGRAAGRTKSAKGDDTIGPGEPIYSADRLLVGIKFVR